MKCPSIKDILMLEDGESSKEEAKKIKDHMEECSNCQQNTDFLKVLSIAVPQAMKEIESERTKDCLDDERLAAYLDNKFSEEKKQKIEEHLTECSLCSQEVVSLREMLDSIEKEGIEETPDWLIEKAKKKGLIPEPKIVEKKPSVYEQICGQIIEILRTLIKTPSLTPTASLTATENKFPVVASLKKPYRKVDLIIEKPPEINEDKRFSFILTIQEQDQKELEGKIIMLYLEDGSFAIEGEIEFGSVAFNKVLSEEEFEKTKMVLKKVLNINVEAFPIKIPISFLLAMIKEESGNRYD